jgi:hypothetical protein
MNFGTCSKKIALEPGRSLIVLLIIRIGGLVTKAMVTEDWNQYRLTISLCLSRFRLERPAWPLLLWESFDVVLLTHRQPGEQLLACNIPWPSGVRGRGFHSLVIQRTTHQLVNTPTALPTITTYHFFRPITETELLNRCLAGVT